MDFLDPKKKQAHLRRLFIGYGLIAVALCLIMYFIGYAANGYGIDRRTGAIIKNGLIVLDAHPEAADVFVNGVKRGSTATRLVMPESEYDVSLQRNGYRKWEHHITLEGSSIEQLVYPFLFPTNLITKTLQEYPNPPALVSQSPDRHWLIVQPQKASLNLTVFDLNNTKNPSTTITIPSDLLSQPEANSSLEAVEWSTDNAHVLLKHTVNDIVEYIMLDRTSPASSLNINKLFPDISFTNVTLRDKKADQVYLLNAVNGDLASADLSNKSVSIIFQHVLSYKAYQADVLAYITAPNPTTNTVELHLVQNKEDYLIRTLPSGKNYLIDMADFNGHFYLVSGSGADGHTYVYKDPFADLKHRPARSPQPFRVLIVPDARYISFSTNARFVVVQNANNFAVYDFEASRQFRYDLKVKLPAEQKAGWMDGHRLSVISDGKVIMFDFDGTNKQTLNGSLDSFTPFFDRDYTAMFTIAPSPSAAKSTTNLMRTELKVLPNAQPTI